MVKFKINGPLKIGKNQPIPKLARKVIENHLGLGLSKESLEAEKESA